MMKEYKFRISKISSFVGDKKTESYYYIEFYKGKWQGWQFRDREGRFTKNIKHAKSWEILSEDVYKNFSISQKEMADCGRYWEGITKKGLVEICRRIASDMGAERYVIEEREEVSF